MGYKKILILVILTTFINGHLLASVTIGITSPPLNTNPFFATDANSQNINRLTHLSLIDFDVKMNLVCLACESFTEKIGKNEHVVKFKLKNNLKFWDGSPISAQNVKNSWEYFIDTKRKSSHVRAFQNILKIEINSKFELTIYFKLFSVENISNLALLKILKKVNPDEFIGAGVYKIVSQKPLETVLKPSFDNRKETLYFKVVKDETTLSLKLLNKELDLLLGGISPRKVNWLLENTDFLEFPMIAGTNYKYISFNHKNNYLKEKAIRKVFSLIIPRKDILKYKLHGTSVLSHGLFSPSFSKFFIKSQVYEKNLSAAKSILEKGGFKKVSNIWSKNKEPLSFDWKVSNNKAAIEIVKLIRDQLKDFGIEIKITVQEWGTFMKNVKKGRFDIIMGQWIGFVGPDMMRFIWHSESIPPNGANRGHYLNPSFDALLDQAREELNEKSRNAIYKKAQLMAENDFVYLGLWHPNISWIKKKCISGLILYPNGGFLGLKNLKNTCR
jgi:peptide/nickel transport system substrate-binding protein